MPRGRLQPVVKKPSQLSNGTSEIGPTRAEGREEERPTAALSNQGTGSACGAPSSQAAADAGARKEGEIPSEFV